MKIEAPSPETTLAVVLGASQWPDFPDFPGSEAFAHAVHDFREYLLDSRYFGLPQENLLDLFDREDGPDKIDRQIRRFLDSRIALMKENAHPAADLLVYFVGHGGFVGRNSDYYLAVRCTSYENPDISGIRIEPFIDMLTTKARRLRRMLILDCCYAGAAYRAFQAEGPAEVAIRQTTTILKEQATEIGEGASLLCSSSKDTPSRIAADGSYTRFSRAFMQVLKEGDPRHTNRLRLSLSEVAALTEEKLRQEAGEHAPRPEVHSPDQENGDVATIPFFPNLGRKIEEPPWMQQVRDGYRKLVEAVWADKILDGEKLTRLTEYYCVPEEDIGPVFLSPEDAASIERNVMGDVKEIIYREQLQTSAYIIVSADIKARRAVIESAKGRIRTDESLFRGFDGLLGDGGKATAAEPSHVVENKDHHESISSRGNAKQPSSRFKDSHPDGAWMCSGCGSNVPVGVKYCEVCGNLMPPVKYGEPWPDVP